MHEVELSGVIEAAAIPDGHVVLYLANATMSNLDLSERDLGQSEFDDVVFEHVNFGRTELVGSRFRNCIFRSCDMAGVSLAEATMRGTRFEQCRMAYSNWFNANLEVVTVTGSSMKESEFAGVTCRKVSFDDVDLTAALFNNVTLKEPRDLDLSGCVIDDSKGIPSVRGVVVDAGQAHLISAALLHEHGIIVDDGSAEADAT